MRYLQPRRIHRETVDRWPVTLEMVKQQCIVEHDDDDVLLERLLRAAVAHAEERTETVLPLTGFEWYPKIGPCGEITMPLEPVRAIQQIRWHDDAGVETTYAAADYDSIINHARGRLRLPRIPHGARRHEPVRVRFLAGCGTVRVAGKSSGFPYQFPFRLGVRAGDFDSLTWPDDVIHAVLMLCATWYEQREAVAVGVSASSVPHAVDALLAPHRVYGL